MHESKSANLNLELYCYLAAYPHMCLIDRTIRVQDFSGLEHFDFTLAWYYEYRTPMICEDVNDLQFLLTSMDHLKSLRLRLSRDCSEDPTFYIYEQVFSAAKVWSKLRTLKLQFMSTTATDLLLLLVFQMPALRHLELGDIKLLEGTWHSMIEGLKESNQLVHWDLEILFFCTANRVPHQISIFQLIVSVLQLGTSSLATMRIQRHGES